MDKRFYKIDKITPIFYNQDLNIRFSAFGDETLESFLRWQSRFYSSWNNRLTNVLLSEQGNISGNTARLNDNQYDIVKADAKPFASQSVLPPLMYKNDVWEVNSKGFVFVNSTPTTLNIGSELKGWALLTLFDKAQTAYLLAIAKPRNSSCMRLTVYTLPFENEPSVVVDSVELESVLDAKSFIICFERHIFIIHGVKMGYFYLSPSDNKLEQCAIGQNGGDDSCEWCRYVKPFIVCDKRGVVYWATDRCLYGIRLGSPANLLTLDEFVGYECVKLQCVENFVFAYYKKNGETVCYQFQVFNDGARSKRKFNDDAINNIFLTLTDEMAQYVKITPIGNSFKAVIAMQGGDGKEVSRNSPLTVNQDIFYYFGEIAENARYVGADIRKNKITFNI